MEFFLNMNRNRSRSSYKSYPARTPFLLWMLLLMCLAATSVQADRKVVLITGAGGEEVYKKKFLEQAGEMRRIFTETLGYAPSDIVILSESPENGRWQYHESTASQIRETFQTLAAELSEKDELIVILLGHGTFDGDWAKFNIPGPDLRDVDFSDLLDRLPCRKVLFVDLTSASGPFIEKLSARDRIIITATRNGIERNATQFARFWIEAMQKGEEADLNKDGQLSATEVFIAARDELVRYYAEKRQLRPEHPLLDDNGDGEGIETPDLLTGDGAEANRFNLAYAKQAPPGVADAPLHRDPKVRRRQEAIMAKVRALQAKKESMPEEEYFREFEKLMLELARLNAQQTPPTQKKP